MIVALFLNTLIKVVVPLSFLVWSFWSFSLAAYMYLAVLLSFSTYIFALELHRPRPDEKLWTEFEIHVIRRYHVALKYPRVANDIACQINGHQIMAWLWAPWMLYHRFWLGPVVLLFFHILVGPKQTFFAPYFHLPQAIKQGCEGAADELATLVQVRERTLGP